MAFRWPHENITAENTESRIHEIRRFQFRSGRGGDAAAADARVLMNSLKKLSTTVQGAILRP